ncbi:hypothetical protein [Rubripirellula obstinata]|uniref:hypothetical protein n=1 Tax=Rubripirellula obstinata TaxID=406547 RepID=UPI00122CB656|nr:hypothetical protein [Rubripirellula obstinata]
MVVRSTPTADAAARTDGKLTRSSPRTAITGRVAGISIIDETPANAFNRIRRTDRQADRAIEENGT